MRRTLPLLGFALYLAGCGGSTAADTGSVTPGGGGSGGSGQGGGSSGTTGMSGHGGVNAGGSGGSVTAGGAGGSTPGAGGAAGKGGGVGAGGNHGGSGGSGEGGASTGGSANAGTGGSTAGSGGSGGSGGGGSLAGSYTLVFGDVAQAMPGGPSPGTPPSIGFDVRLDIRLTPAGIEALFTPHFRPTVALQVTPSAGALVLTGDAAIAGGGPGGSTTDDWMTLTLPLDANGLLAGTVSGKGQETTFSGDVVFMQDITGNGTISPDHVVPEYQTTVGDPEGPADAMLPWDPIFVDVSEGVDPQTLLGATTLLNASGSAVPASITVPPQDVATLWGGARRVEIDASSWGSSDGTPLLLGVAAGVPDLAGNPATSLSLSTAVMPVGPAMDHHFEGDVVFEGSWGLATFLGGKSGSDPHCMNGGCGAIGPLWTDVCTKTPSGIAGRIATTKAGKVSVSYRITSPGQSGIAPSTFPPAFDLVLVAHGSPATVSNPTLTPSDYTDQGAGAGDERFVTAWKTETFDAPDPGQAAEIGFALRAGGFDSCLGFTPQPTPMTIYVDDVVMAP